MNTSSKSAPTPASKEMPHAGLVSKEVLYVRRVVSFLSVISPRLAARLTSFVYFFPKKVKARIGKLIPAAELIEVPAPGGKVHRFYAWGQGPMVLFIHGWGGSGAQCRHLIKPLVGAGLRLVTFDAPAHGENMESKTDSLQIVECVKRFAAAHPGGLKAIVAHSFGSIVALKAIGEGVNVSALALVAPPDPDQVLVKFAALLQLSDKVLTHHKRLIERRFKPLGVNPWVAFSLERLASVRVQPLVVHDTADEEVKLDEGRHVAKALGASAHLITQGFGHHRLLSSPEAIAAIQDFITSKVRTEDTPSLQG